jgi:hypothetical protein
MIKRQRNLEQQSGLVIVMLALVLVVLLGVAALALDLGRLYVLKSEMQNAADAAALAGAAELDGKNDAIERATLAAKDLLKYNSHFSTVKGLLGDQVSIGLEFYCSIGGANDVNSDCPGEAKTPIIDPDDPYAHYIKVTLDPNASDANEAHYGIDLYFLPVLSVIGIDTANRAVTATSALAGRHFYFCNYPPMMMCDPYENSGGFLGNDGEFGTSDDNIEPGDEILLKKQGPNSTWSPGDFGFLDLPKGEPPEFQTGGGAKENQPYMADEGDLGCTPPAIMPLSGAKTGPMSDAWNTRFGIYPKNDKLLTEDNYPPADVVSSYGGYFDPDHPNACPADYSTYCDSGSGTASEPVCFRDSDLLCPPDIDGNRIGNGEWNAQEYWTANGLGTAPTDVTRYQTYVKELENKGITVDENEPNRRVMFVAVVSCNDLNLRPSNIYPINEPDGFAKFFITEPSAGAPAVNFFVEYMGWAEEKEANYRVVVQLYE